MRRVARARRAQRFHVLFMLAVFMGVLAVAVEAGAQGEGKPLTLEESIAIALERNLEVQVAEEEVQAALEARKEARTGFLPKFSADYNYRRLSETPYVIIQGSQFDIGDQDQYRFSAGVRQPLFDGLEILSSYQLAKLGLDVAEIQLTRARLDLILRVKEAYIDILTAERIAEVDQQSVKELEEGVQVAQDFYDVGMSPKIDVLDAQTRLAEAEQRLIVSKHGVQLAKARFNTVLRQPIDTAVSVVDVLTDQPFDKTYDRCVEIALEKRPEMMEAQKNVASAEKEITLSQSDYYPDLYLSSNYYRAGDGLSVNGSSFVDRENWDVAVEASFIFFEWGKTRFATRQKRSRLRQAEKAYEQVRDDIQLEVKTAFLVLQAAEQNIGVARKSVVSAEENFRISGERYEEQVATATEVLDAQTRLTRAKTNYTRAMASFNLARANLIRAMGLGTES